MKKLGQWIVKGRYAILAVFITAFILSAVAIFFVNINSDIVSYLPDDSNTMKGMHFLQETFEMQGDAIVALEDFSEEEVAQLVGEIQKMDGVKENGAIWSGTFSAELSDDMLDSLPAELQEFARAILAGLKDNEELKKIFHPEDNVYLIMLQLSVPSSSNEAFAVVNAIESMLAGRSFALGGSTMITKQIFDSTLGEIPMYLIVGVIVVLIILFLTTKSFVEPLILLMTLGISIIINLGTNIIMPDVSIITFAASSILQLGLAMDYAIFLMHAYHEEKARCLDVRTAMERAIPKTFSTVLSSALTTVGGFLALFCMQFKIGPDLGIVLAKGVALSLMTVLLLQPCLILLFDKLVDKTQHRMFMPKFAKIGSFAIKHNRLIAIACLVILIPAMIGQLNISYSYMKFEKDTGQAKTNIEQIADKMSNTIIVLVPVANSNAHYNFIESVKGLDHVEAMMGLYSMVDKENAELVDKYLPLLDYLPENPLSGFVNKGYTMYSIMINAETESSEATATLAAIRNFLNENFAGKETYVTGMAQNVVDLAEVTPRDFTVVTLVSILIILVILLFTLKSFRESILLLAVIEFGILINLAINYFMGQAVNFMAYIIISSIQLGATVDYAILLTVRYKRLAETMPHKEAIFRAVKESALSIVTSASIIFGACLSVALITSNQIISEVTMLIARGAVISGILVLVALPSLLVVFARKSKKPFRWNFKKRKTKLSKNTNSEAKIGSEE